MRRIFRRLGCFRLLAKWTGRVSVLRFSSFAEAVPGFEKLFVL